MNLTVKKLFLIDAVGAMISSLLLGVVLVHFQPIIGMPTSILYKLALVALGLMTFSGLCRLLIKENFRSFLMTIGIANISYCIASLYLINIYFEELTYLGFIYFIIEKVIVLTLAFIEIKTAMK